MPLHILPLVTPVLAPVLNGLVKTFNDASGRTMQKNLEGQRLVHQKELQEKQITAQFEIEYMRTMSQIKLQQNNQEFQEKLEIARQEFQGKIVEYQCQENRKLQEFIKGVDMQIAKSNQEFQAWLFKQEKQHQIELAQYNRESQYLNAVYQRETTLEMKELDNWPLRNYSWQILKSHQGRDPIPVQVILALPEIGFDRFECLNRTSTSTFSEVEKPLSQHLKNFLEKHYPLENQKRPTELIDHAWDSNRFAGGSAVKTIFSRLKSEPILLIESEVNNDLINIKVAYWSGGQEISPFYKTIISKLDYRKVLYEFAIQRALDWETNVEPKLLAIGKTQEEINQKFVGDNALNLSIYREYQELQAEGIEFERAYKTNSDDFDKLLALLGAYHNIIAALFTDIHYLINTNLSPKLPELLAELETEFSIEKRLADNLFKMVVESYIGSLTAMIEDRSELVPGFAADVAFSLTSLSDSNLAERMLDFSLESWLKSRHISIENNREKIDMVDDNLLPLDQEFIGKVNRCLSNLGQQKNLDVINSCYCRANNNLQIEKYQEAIIDFSYVVDLNPCHAEAHHFRGHAYYNLGKYQEALDDYNQAIDLGRNEASEHKKIVLGILETIKREVEKKIRLEKELSKEELFTFEVVRVNASGSIVNRSQGSARQKIEDLGNGVSLEMVKIPGGRFLMGSPDTEAKRYSDEGPQHYVDVPEFFMGKYVVTQGQWKAIASRTDLKVKLDLKPEPSDFKEPYNDIDRWKRPVECVNWYEAVEFCKRLSKLTGRNY
ncbi:MAG: SUMF1/EgtB/PvdO family nonheme iron enzyme, partial [Trichodesmium sp. St16_bin2-tuft]|nr:SUMF1/EgtB/PvdO family nonheme iron enzyme [Trichodesmium sp. St16_bin2-tuft]